MAIDNRIGDDLLLAQVEREEDMLLQSADAVDTKSSQIFSAMAILAAQPAILFSISAVPKTVLAIQGMVAIPIFLGLYFAHRALQLRTYNTSDFSDVWRDEIIQPADKKEDDARDLLVWSLLVAARGRVIVAAKQNGFKQSDLERARNCLAWGIALNVATIVLATMLRFH